MVASWAGLKAYSAHCLIGLDTSNTLQLSPLSSWQKVAVVLLWRAVAITSLLEELCCRHLVLVPTKTSRGLESAMERQHGLVVKGGHRLHSR